MPPCSSCSLCPVILVLDVDLFKLNGQYSFLLLLNCYYIFKRGPFVMMSMSLVLGVNIYLFCKYVKAFRVPGPDHVLVISFIIRID